MKRNFHILICFLLIITFSACSARGKDEINRDTLYKYSGELFSIVKANGKPKSEDIKEKYFVSVLDFHPEGALFDKYNDQYAHDPANEHEPRVISITDHTRIYQLTVDRKMQLDVATLERNRYKHIEFWIVPHGYVLEAMEIDLLE